MAKKKNQSDKAYTTYEYMVKEAHNANRRLNRIAQVWGIESDTYKVAIKKMKEYFGEEFWYEVPKGKKSAGELQVSEKVVRKKVKEYQAEYGEVNTWNKISDFNLKKPKTVGEIKKNAKEHLEEVGVDASKVTDKQAIEHAESLSTIQLSLDSAVSNYYELQKILENEIKLIEDSGEYISDEVKNAYQKFYDLLNNRERNDKGQLTDTNAIQDAIDTMKGVLKEINRLKQVSRDEKNKMADLVKEEQAKRNYGRNFKMK